MHPVLFYIGPVALYSYSAMLALGFLAAVTLASRRARAARLDPARIQTLSWVMILCGIVGARLTFVVLNWELFRSDPLEIFRLRHGGLVFYGGLGLGLGAGVLTMFFKKLPIGKTIDLMTPPLVLAHAVGRIGCFLNGCCYGKPTSLPWGVSFPGEGILRHPTQLYESAGLLILFFLLKRIERSSPVPGRLFLIYGLSYGIWRFAIEFLRGDNPAALAGLTPFQLISLFLVAACGLGLAIRR